MWVKIITVAMNNMIIQTMQKHIHSGKFHSLSFFLYAIDRDIVGIGLTSLNEVSTLNKHTS